ncbi:hypothetical protein [Parageobacillus thermoglucosidasius]|uniref:hypothetical protein n=1 Tax=Parageobacillus thermoglucosidasius TaxID=1426 RepID=UPI000B075678|nr:hypothetical protein [Parageobacillus thermoglucosidasius]
MLERCYALGRKPYLSPKEEHELKIKKMLEESTSADEGYGIETCWNTPDYSACLGSEIFCHHVPWQY